MKRIILTVLLLSLPAFGASLRPADKTITAKQKTALAALVTAANAETCVNLSLPATCTQAQAVAKNPAVVWHADIDAYATWVWSATVDNWLTLDIVQTDGGSFCDRFRAKNSTQRDAQCTSASEPAGCTFGCKVAP